LFVQFDQATHDCFFFSNLERPGYGHYLSYHTGLQHTSQIFLSREQTDLRECFGGHTIEPDATSLPPSSSSHDTTADEPVSDTRVLPKTLGEFEIVSLLGEGGMGTVYRAVQPTLGRQVALKTLQRLSSSSAEQRFHREIQALGRIEHPHLVKIYTSGTHEHQTYYAMELIEGADLSHTYKQLKQGHQSKPNAQSDIPGKEITEEAWQQAIQQAQQAARNKEQRIKTQAERPTEPPVSSKTYADDDSSLFAEAGATGTQTHGHTERIVTLLRQVAQATHALHESGVLHRDIKPGNIMLTQDGHHAVLMDLGLARLADEDTDTQLTVTHQFMGTPLYASPEQCMGVDRVDRRADVYSLGATLYECLTFQPLFSFDDKRIHEILDTIRNQEPIPPHKQNPLLPPDLSAIIMKCLEKDRNRRYATAGLLAEDLERWLKGEPVLAQPPTFGYLLQKFIHRNRAQFVSTAVVGVTLLLSVIVAFVWINEARKAALTAQQQEKVARTDAEQASKQLQRTLQKLLQSHQSLQYQTKAALHAQQQAQIAVNQARQQRKRLLIVQRQILEERIQLLLTQKKLKRAPLNAILAFSTQVLQDQDNPIAQRLLASEGLLLLVQRNEAKLRDQLNLEPLRALIQAAVHSLPTSSAHRHPQLTLQLSALLLMLRNHIPESFGEPTRPLPPTCRNMPSSAIELSPVLQRIACTRPFVASMAADWLAMLQLRATKQWSPALRSAWKRTVHLHESNANSTLSSTMIQPWRLRRIAIQLARTAPASLFATQQHTLLKARHDNHHQVRIAAINTLTTQWKTNETSLSSKDLHSFLQQRNDAPFLERLTLVKAVGHIAQKRPIYRKKLLFWLYHSTQKQIRVWQSWQVRQAANRAIGRLIQQNPQLTSTLYPLLQKDLQHPQWRIRRNALDGIQHILAHAHMVPNTLFALVEASTRDPHHSPRFAAYKAFATMVVRFPGLRLALQPILQRGTRDANPWIVRSSLSGIERLMALTGTINQPLIALLNRCLRHPSSHVQAAAMQAVETAVQLRPALLTQWRHILFKRANDPGWRVHKTALSVLNDLFRHLPPSLQKQYFGQLLRALYAPRALWRKQAFTLLAKRTRHPRFPAMRTWAIIKRLCTHRSTAWRQTGFEALGRISENRPAWHAAALALLAQGIDDSQANVRQIALRFLPALHNKTNTKQIWTLNRSGLNDPDHKARKQAIQNIGALGAKSDNKQHAIQQLMHILDVETRDLREAALVALGQLMAEQHQQHPWLPYLLRRISRKHDPQTANYIVAFLRFAMVDVSAGLRIASNVPNTRLREHLYHAFSHPMMVEHLAFVLFPQYQRELASWLTFQTPQAIEQQNIVPSPWIRAKAAELLSYTCHPRAASLLTKALKRETHPLPQTHILLALGRIQHTLSITKRTQLTRHIKQLARTSSSRAVKQAIARATQPIPTKQRQAFLKRRYPRLFQGCYRFARAAAYTIQRTIPGR
jgi:serine/threonine protein kinase